MAEIKPEDKTELEDCHNNVTEVIEMDGHYFNAKLVYSQVIPNPKTNLPRLKNMALHTNDVFICAYPKAGTHWIWEITKMILQQGALYQTKPKSVEMYEFNAPEHLVDLRKPRVYNSHLMFRALPTQLKEKDCKIIFVQRNPKDIATSLYHHYKDCWTTNFKGTFTEFIDLFMGGKVSFAPLHEYTLDWKKAIEDNPDLQVHQIMYEDLKKDLIGQIKQIAHFLSVPCDDKLTNDIVTKCSFLNHKQANMEIKDRQHEEFIYRRGEVGDWKNHFTVALNEKFDTYLYKHLTKSKFTYTYEMN